jgi:RNA-directed DNA polymerase
MNRREQVASGLATALLAGPWERDAQRKRVAAALGRRTPPKWVLALVDQVRETYPQAPADRPRELAAVVQN